MPDAFKNYHAAAEHVGLTLVAALRKFLPGEPWSAVRRLVENRHVQINGNLCADEGRRLCEGDVVKVWDEPRDAPPAEEDITILFQDAHLIVVEKPAGITTERHAEERHWPAKRKQRQPTIDEIVARVLQRQRGKRRSKSPHPGPLPEGEGDTCPRVAARHIYATSAGSPDTSGVMVLALSMPNAGAAAGARSVRQARHPPSLSCDSYKGRVEEQEQSNLFWYATAEIAAAWQHDVAQRRTASRYARSTPGILRWLYFGGVPPRDRTHAPDSHSHGRGRASSRWREGIQPAAIQKADRRSQRRPAAGATCRRVGIQAPDYRRRDDV